MCIPAVACSDRHHTSPFLRSQTLSIYQWYVGNTHTMGSDIVTLCASAGVRDEKFYSSTADGSGYRKYGFIHQASNLTKSDANGSVNDNKISRVLVRQFSIDSIPCLHVSDAGAVDGASSRRSSLWRQPRAPRRPEVYAESALL